MKAPVYSKTGRKVGEIELPIHFKETIRPDVIKRVVVAIQSHRLQPYGVNEMAGKRKVIWLSKRRRDYKTTYGRGQSRTPRKTLARRGRYFLWVGAFAPQTRGGREAHPPKVERKLEKRVNEKERKLAIRSAIAATAVRELVQKRHRYNGDVPIVLKDEVEKLKKAKEVEKLLKKLGMEKELERIKERKIRAGKGKMRGRKYKKRVGPLFVVSKRCDLMKSARNLGDVILVKDLNAEVLAPGTQPGRLTLWTESAIKELEKGLFL